MPVSPRALARSCAIGRVALGAALVVAPRPTGRAWIGEDARRGGPAVLARALGVREVVLGMMAVHTLDHPEVAPRWQRTLAGCDLADLGATVAARRSLPPGAVAGIVALAGTAAAAELWAAGRLA